MGLVESIRSWGWEWVPAVASTAAAGFSAFLAWMARRAIRKSRRAYLRSLKAFLELELVRTPGDGLAKGHAESKLRIFNRGPARATEVSLVTVFDEEASPRRAPKLTSWGSLDVGDYQEAAYGEQVLGYHLLWFDDRGKLSERIYMKNTPLWPPRSPSTLRFRQIVTERGHDPDQLHILSQERNRESRQGSGQQHTSIDE